MEVNTLPKALINMTSRDPNRTALRWKHLGLWKDVTWSEYLEKVKYTALGLNALGVKKGDHVSIIGENKPEWLYSALGVLLSGAAFAGIYTTNPTAECEYVVGHSDSVVYICEDEEQFDKALEFRNNTPKLKKIIVWDMEGLKHFKDSMLMSFNELLALGEKINQESPELYDQLVSAGNPDDIAVVIYTSGTTGRPKGALLTHDCYLWQGKKCSDVIKATENDESISFLPLNHVYEQIFDLMVHLTVGHIVNFTENTDTVTNDIIQVSPTFLHAVPRIWEKYYSSITLRMEDATWFKQKVFNLALKIGTRYNDFKLERKEPALGWKILYGIAHFIVFRKLKKRLGFERGRLGFSGAAPISHNVLKFFQSIGVPVYEGYGLTETTGISHMSSGEGRFKFGTVGKPLPDAEIKLADDSEILVRHQAIFKGYYKDDKATKEALDDEGWLHTGDIGEIDDEGFLKITDRKKDLIITAGGKNIAPQFIENLLKFSPYINDSVVIGDRRKYITALIVIDEENVVKFAQDNKVSFTTFASLTQTEEIQNMIKGEVDKVNNELARVEQIKKFKILDKKLYTEDGEVTPTMKVKRKAISEQYKDIIESMYR